MGHFAAFLLYLRLPPCCSTCDACCWPHMYGEEADAFEAAVHASHAGSLRVERDPVWGEVDKRAVYCMMQKAAATAAHKTSTAKSPQSAVNSGPLTKQAVRVDAAVETVPQLDDSAEATAAQEGAAANAAHAPTRPVHVHCDDTPLQLHEPLPMLWRLTFFFERMALRQSLAWETRPKWWTAAFVLGTTATCCYVLRMAFSTFVLCPQYDSAGERYYDYCSA